MKNDKLSNNWQIPNNLLKEIKEQHPGAAIGLVLSEANKIIPKMWEDSKHCKIVCLVKVDTSTRWWSTFWDYNKLMCNKPGCRVIFFPKRLKFDPPQELIDSGEVWKHCGKCDGEGTIYYSVKNSQGKHERDEYKRCDKCNWVQKCRSCCSIATPHGCPYGDDKCLVCKGKGYKPLSGAAFGCALLIFDRRGL
jgi:hypothetical protein